MAALFQFPTSISFSSHNPIFSSKPQQWISWKTHEYRPRRSLKICAFSIKRPRSGRKVKSNEELCNDIREFVAEVGLPEGHVPSFKELSQHGRNDLANIVRRRGYKLIQKLLSSSPETDGLIADTSVVQKHNATSDSEDTFEGQYLKSENATEVVPLSTEAFNTENKLVAEDIDSDDHNCMRETTVYTSGDQMEMESTVLEDVSTSTLLPFEENYSGSLSVNLDQNSDDSSFMPEESPAMSILEEKVARFVQNGDLDAIECACYADTVYEKLNETNDEVATQSRTGSEDRLRNADDAVSKSNGSATVAKQVAPPVAMDYLPWSYDKMEAQTLNSDDSREDLDSKTTGRDTIIEINHLQFLLHQKELELSLLKEQIEKEKIALASMQNKAETEIQKAQKLVSEKDAELLAAEESLSGLQEVQLEYTGDGEIVEVSGSFNGWHHRIKLDPKPSSTTKTPLESSKSKIWSTVLWLYPGVYEIKFVVDGQWTLDPQRESTTSSRICNNILRVDR
ncbi:protein PTST homolog 3, chloroplastic isoform X2 [Gossypium raimondii]|uniref:protein PTST homolog 3, chloroplastic isoform X2 n=1 Tax=Gossypium raimondii TaxID=29730 RepID=UPI00227AB5C6|nr:protein PTST homolog 3, chloroplastic isoform X2 [Gossypium raimondii]